MMIAYWCPKCEMYLREAELMKVHKCPECLEQTKPRLLLGGQVMGEAQKGVS
jgi:hypothetical protein